MEAQKHIPKKRDSLRMSNKESNRLTRECLQTALISLMGQKSFDKITISELVRRSGVSRTAFYRNYRTKEDVLREIFEVYKKLLADTFADGRIFHDPYHWYLDFFHIIKENAPSFRLLLQAHLLNTPVFKTMTPSPDSEPVPKPEDLYRFLAWESALTTIAVRWFETDMKESIEFMAEFCAGFLRLTFDSAAKPDFQK